MSFDTTHMKARFTKVFLMIQEGDLEGIKQILKHPDVDVNSKDGDGITPLLHAAWVELNILSQPLLFSIL